MCKNKYYPKLSSKIVIQSKKPFIQFYKKKIQKKEFWD